MKTKNPDQSKVLSAQPGSDADGREQPMLPTDSQPRPAYDPTQEFIRLKRNMEWDAARLPKRHKLKLGKCTGDEWRNTVTKLREGLRTGFVAILVGQRGAGKTQIAVEIAGQNIELTIQDYLADPYSATNKSWGYSVRYCEALEFFMDIKSVYSLSQRTEKQVIAEYTGPSLLVVDEFTNRGESKWEDDLLSLLVNKRYAEMKDTILIGNCASVDIPGHLGPSIVSRACETGGILECKWESFRRHS